MGFFVALVNDKKPSTNVTRRFIIDAAGILGNSGIRLRNY